MCRYIRYHCNLAFEWRKYFFVNSDNEVSDYTNMSSSYGVAQVFTMTQSLVQNGSDSNAIMPFLDSSPSDKSELMCAAPIAVV